MPRDFRWQVPSAKMPQIIAIRLDVRSVQRTQSTRSLVHLNLHQIRMTGSLEKFDKHIGTTCRLRESPKRVKDMENLAIGVHHILYP